MLPIPGKQTVGMRLFAMGEGVDDSFTSSDWPIRARAEMGVTVNRCTSSPAPAVGGGAAKR